MRAALDATDRGVGSQVSLIVKGRASALVHGMDGNGEAGSKDGDGSGPARPGVCVHRARVNRLRMRMLVFRANHSLHANSG